jgi:hypothetical protein
MWPAFMAATVADATIGGLLPPTGDSQAIVAAAVIGLVLNMIGLVAISWPAAAVLRRFRPDLPVIVARDYAGTVVVGLITVALLGAGLLHRDSVLRDRRAMQDAIVRAQAYIGDRAPAEFRRNVEYVSTFTIQPGSVYRACVPSLDGRRTYCVVVDTSLPFQRSVRFSGYESNATFSTGVN